MQPRANVSLNLDETVALYTKMSDTIREIQISKVNQANSLLSTITKSRDDDQWKQSVCANINKQISFTSQETDILVSFSEYQKFCSLVIQYNVSLRTRLDMLKKLVADNMSTLLTAHYAEYSALMINISNDYKTMIEHFKSAEGLRVACQPNLVKAKELQTQYLQIEVDLNNLNPENEKCGLNELSSVVIRKLLWDKVKDVHLTSRKLLFNLFDSSITVHSYDKLVTYFNANKQEYMQHMSKAKTEVEQFFKIVAAKKVKDDEIQAKHQLGQFKPAQTQAGSTVNLQQLVSTMSLTG